jgi:hypothetical protein
MTASPAGRFRRSGSLLAGIGVLSLALSFLVTGASATDHGHDVAVVCQDGAVRVEGSDIASVIWRDANGFEQRIENGVGVRTMVLSGAAGAEVLDVWVDSGGDHGSSTVSPTSYSGDGVGRHFPVCEPVEVDPVGDGPGGDDESRGGDEGAGDEKSPEERACWANGGEWNDYGECDGVVDT